MGRSTRWTGEAARSIASLGKAHSHAAFDTPDTRAPLLPHAVPSTLVSRLLASDIVCCRAWVTSVERSCQQKQDRLESELNSAKASLIKESIRLGHQELGDYFYNRGDLQVRYNS